MKFRRASQLLMVALAATTTSVWAGSYFFRFNGKELPSDVAPAFHYHRLPVLNGENVVLTNKPVVTDVLELHTGSYSVTGRIDDARLFICSDGMEMILKDESIQELLALMIDMFYILHTSQKPLTLQPTVNEQPIVYEYKTIIDERIILKK